MALVTIGDLHLNEDREWSLPVGEKVLEYIANSPYNKEENTLILLGDLTEKQFFSGLIYDQLMQLFHSLKYKKVYILKGNHDEKKNANGKVTLTYHFLKNKKNQKAFPNFEVIEVPTVKVIEDNKILFLPHLTTTENQSNSMYEKLPPELADEEYFLTVTHIADTSVDSYPGKLLNIDYIKTKYWSSGHVHLPSERYCGSLIANSFTEAGQKKQIRVYENGKQTIVPVKSICDYYEVEFPNPLPPVESEIPIWTIKNCKDEQTAILQYGNIYIRNCIYEITTDMSEFENLSKTLSAKEDRVPIKDLFKDYRTKSRFSPEVLDLAEKFLLGV